MAAGPFLTVRAGLSSTKIQDRHSSRHFLWRMSSVMPNLVMTKAGIVYSRSIRHGRQKPRKWGSIGLLITVLGNDEKSKWTSLPVNSCYLAQWSVICT